MPLDAAARTRRARAAAHAMHARGLTNTHTAREAFDQRFLNEVDPHRELAEDERARRAKHARALYFMRLTEASVRARSRPATAGT